MDLINKNKIFTTRSDLSKSYNLICTFKDRILSIVDYLNKHNRCPTTEKEFIVYMVYACMLYDGFNKIHENLLHKVPPYKKGKSFLDT